MKRIAVLGSTGSIGKNTLKIAERKPDLFKIVSLSAGTNIELLKEQILKFKPLLASVINLDLAKKLEGMLPSGCASQIVGGIEGVVAAATLPQADLVVAAIAGAAGLVPTFEAIRAGKDIALANKESLVMAGKLLMAEAKTKNVKIIPIDSEHSAIFQSLAGNNKEEVKRILLTASGGPFLNHSCRDLSRVSPAEALRHPRWSMGKKVTIDSATLMNKGLEVIEATWLFDVPAEIIDVYIHPQSIIHSLVEYIDGSVIAQLSLPDMKIPIAYALSYPERINTGMDTLNFLEIESLTFQAPDEKRFPALKLAYRAIKKGETMPAAMNAANEVAVEAFLQGQIRFVDIFSVVEETMNAHQIAPFNNLEDILMVDRESRNKAKELLN